MSHLKLVSLNEIDELLSPEAIDNITINSPATRVFTDFKYNQPLMIDSDVSIDEAERLMKAEHVKLKFVVNNQMKLLGVIALEDINSQQIMKKMAQGLSRNELYVNDFIKPLSAIKALEYSELERTKIKDVVELLKENGHQHCLVIDTGMHKVRGIISASDIARRLKIPMDLMYSKCMQKVEIILGF